MTVIWVAEDINKDGTFKQTKAEVLCTLSCLLFIKHYYPNFKTIFFVDQYTKKYYEQFGFLSLFDEVNETLLDEECGINKTVYWAAGKIIAQRSIEGPTLTLDLDFRIFNDISKFNVFESDISCLWMEDIRNQFYMTPQYAMSYTYLDWKLPWDYNAFNTSFLFLKNESFKNLYCDLAISYMRSNYKILPNTLSKVENSKFMMFVEQYMLRQLSKEHNQKCSLLIDNFSPINTNDDLVKSVGLNLENCGNHFYHYGDHKTHMIIKDNFCMNEIERCTTKTNNVIIDEMQLNVFNKLSKRDINEGCFC
jgi:hypothetical protein